MTDLLVVPSPAGKPTFWRLEDPELDDDGRVIRGGMWEHQRQWRALPNFIKGLVTGFGGGKTMALGKRMIELAIMNAPVPVITVSPTYPMASMTVVQTIDELLEGKTRNESAAGRRFAYHLYRSQPFRFVINCGGRIGTIWCMSGENPQRLKGPNVAAAGIDEPFIQDEQVFQITLSRIRHPNARRQELNITGTPEGVVGWGFELFEGDLRRKHDVGLVQCDTDANRALSPDYGSRLAATFDDNMLAAYKGGKFVNMRQGRVYYAFDSTVNVATLPIPEGAEVCAGMDFNVNPMAFVLFWRKGDRLHYVKEYELPNSDTQDAARKLLSDFPKCLSIYPDASGNNRSTKSPGGKSDFHYLREAGLRVFAHAANPPLRDRYNSANGALKTGKVTISPECKKLRQYLMAVTHQDMNTSQQKPMIHLLDAFSYPIAYLLPALGRISYVA